MDVLRTEATQIEVSSKRHKSIQMLFQRRYGDELNLARDDIFKD